MRKCANRKVERQKANPEALRISFYQDQDDYGNRCQPLKLKRLIEVVVPPPLWLLLPFVPFLDHFVCRLFFVAAILQVIKLPLTLTLFLPFPLKYPQENRTNPNINIIHCLNFIFGMLPFHAFARL